MKKITTTIITLFITILFFAGCVKNQPPEPVKPTQITLSQIGTSGSLHNDASAWEVLDLADYDLWVLYIKKDRLASHLNSGDAYAVLLDGQNFLLQSNPFNANVVKLLLPSQDKPKDLLSLVIQPINARESGMMKNDIPLAIEKIYITKDENNGTRLNEITVVNYTDMYADEDKSSFAWDNGSFIRPSHVKSNEENAYEVNTYFDARTVATTESATGAFQFLLDQNDYEKFIIMENPNRFIIHTDDSTELMDPDDRWRVRQLGSRGELNGSNVFNIVDDPSKDHFTLSIDKVKLQEATYTGTYFWETQLKESTICWFDKTEYDNIFETTIPYTDAPSTELILNARFQAVEYKVPDVELLTPTNRGGTGELDVTLTWEATPGDRNDPSGSSSREANTLAITQYNVYFATDGTAFPEPATTTQKSLEKTGLIYGTTYNWTVEAIQNDTKVSSPASHSFTVGSIIVSKDGEVVNTYTKDNFKEAVDNAADGSVIQIAVDLEPTELITIDGTELTIKSMKVENVTLNWNENSQGFVLSNGASVTLEGLNLINCKIDDGSLNEGAAITLIDAVTLNIVHTLVASNTGADTGGILARENNTVTITSSTFTGNSNNAVYATGSNLIITDSYFASNTSEEGSVTGAVHAISSNATLTGTDFVCNQSVERAGALYIEGATVTVDDCVFDGNTLTATSESSGTGLYIHYDCPSTVTVKGSTFKNMEACQGAGLYIGNGEVTLYNNTFENLNVTQKGGAVYVANSPTYPTLYNSEGTAWKWLNAPAQTAEFVEKPSSNNNSYNHCSINDDTNAEGAEICFAEKPTPRGGLAVEPNQDVYGEDPFAFKATYIFQDYTAVETSEGTVTFKVPSLLNLTDDASITIGTGPKQPLSTVDYNAAEGTVFVTGITGTNPIVVLDLYQTNGLPAGKYSIKVIADADGTGTACSPSGNFNDSGTASTTLTIKSLGIFTLEKDGSSESYETFEAAFNEIGDGETATITTSESTEVIVTAETLIDNGKDIRIKPAEGATITFKGDGEDHRIFQVNGFTNGSPGASLTLYNTVVQNGKNQIGAGFFVRKAHLELENCEVIYNQSSGSEFGAGIYMVDDSTAVIQNTVIAHNATTEGNGAGIFVSNSEAVIENTVIASNTTTEGNGAGIFVSGSDATITQSTICYNTASDGGGVNVYISNVSITDTLIASNTAKDSGGGVYLNHPSTELETANSTISSNSAATKGGGIYLSDGKLHLDDCVISNNSSENDGGGIYMDPLGALPTLYFNSGHIKLNHASGNGGGIYRNGGYVYTEDGQWNFIPNIAYDLNFSVKTTGQMDELHVGPAKIYDNEANGNGSQMKW